MTSIRKAVITALSPTHNPANLTITTTTLPSPTPSQAQLAVLYAGFSGADINMARGRYPLQRKAPLTPGYCLVGRVLTPPSSSSSSEFKPGDTVAAVTVYDAQAERINVPTTHLVKVPDSLAGNDLALRQVTALALDWNTAFGMVYHTAREHVGPGKRVFVHGMSGAVGQGLVALCALRGAEVYGTASGRNHAALETQRGVKGVFDYRDKAWVEEVKRMGGVDVVFDPLGGASWDESYDVLRQGGMLVGYGQNQTSLDGKEGGHSPWWPLGKLILKGMVPFSGKKTAFYYIKPGSGECNEGLATLMDMLSEKKIEVPIKKVWDFTEEGIREAHESWGKISGMGSLLIRVAGGEKV
ncbi:protein indc11 [Echria macrotheca]|uniref:Protein indc11 n=1 Tax=Echria macrotheca TaxID=438768 RepID=A0AAJ0F7F6_9PEZI|nr:protein indc11 [Echria macrotheca]